MKVITEAVLRQELRASEPETYYIPDGKILSPAAREYLQQRKIKIAKETQAAAAETPSPVCRGDSAAAREPLAKFVDYETGAFFTEKPEHITHLCDNVLVSKSHPRIAFRGKLDSLQAKVVLMQAVMHEEKASAKLIGDLDGILALLREMMRCDVLGEPFVNDRIIGLTHAELRERSHDPMKFFNIKQMLLPSYSMGKHYAMLNDLRTAVRETEVAAEYAFRDGRKCTRTDLIESLNRLSSAVHIMMCMYLAGAYK